uniref:Secreted protein n=1 Tax=Panagrellus redivivus TaxID=6233 RepID=A0A7E4VI71_PANRE
MSPLMCTVHANLLCIVPILECVRLDRTTQMLTGMLLWVGSTCMCNIRCEQEGLPDSEREDVSFEVGIMRPRKRRPK